MTSRQTNFLIVGVILFVVLVISFPWLLSMYRDFFGLPVNKSTEVKGNTPDSKAPSTQTDTSDWLSPSEANKTETPSNNLQQPTTPATNDPKNSSGTDTSTTNAGENFVGPRGDYETMQGAYSREIA